MNAPIEPTGTATWSGYSPFTVVSIPEEQTGSHLQCSPPPDSEARQIQDRLLLLRAYGAIMAFRDPENRFPEDSGEFRELGNVADDIAKVLGIVEPQPPDCAIPAPPDGFLMFPTVAYRGKLESEGKV